MNKGPRITQAKKFLIAVDFVSGLPLPGIAEKNGVTESAVSRLRREDEVYQQVEKELTEELITELGRSVRGLAGLAVAILKEVMTVNHSALEQGVAKILEQKRRAANDLLR